MHEDLCMRMWIVANYVETHKSWKICLGGYGVRNTLLVSFTCTIDGPDEPDWRVEQNYSIDSWSSLWSAVGVGAIGKIGRLQPDHSRHAHTEGT